MGPLFLLDRWNALHGPPQALPPVPPGDAVIVVGPGRGDFCNERAVWYVRQNSDDGDERQVRFDFRESVEIRGTTLRRIHLIQQSTGGSIFDDDEIRDEWGFFAGPAEFLAQLVDDSERPPREEPHAKKRADETIGDVWPPTLESRHVLDGKLLKDGDVVEVWHPRKQVWMPARYELLIGRLYLGSASDPSRFTGKYRAITRGLRARWPEPGSKT